jgi:ATP-binding cassette subfamily B protein
VRFRYQDSPDRFGDLIDGVDLSLEPGETMALVGLTGSGKTTLTALTTRLYDVTGGSITLDGVDIRALSREELRTHIAMAFEDATLFSASVRDNVLLGRPELAGDEPAVRARPSGCSPRRCASRRRASPTTCPTASTRRSARRA